MNNKRQTIWLVSMLSLMVILSAYYLFTEDVTPAQNAAGTKQQTEASGAQKATGGLADGVQITELEPAADGIDGTDGAAASKTDGAAAGKTDEAAAKDQGGKTDQAAAPGGNGQTGGKDGVSAGDAAVLKEMSNLKGAQLIDDMKRRQIEWFDSQNEKLNAIVADTKNHSQAEASSAVEEMARLQDADERMTSLEEKLFQDYDNAVVVEENTNFKVVVQADKLDKKEAVKILDLAAKELNVTPDRLSVQYVGNE